MIKLNPNLDNIEIYQKFNDILDENIISFMNIPIINKNEHQTIINDMYLQLTSSIKNAYDSCCRTCSYNNIIKKKNWFTFELRKIKKKILELRFRNNNINHLNNEIKDLKRKFKKIMKKNIYLYEKNEFYKIDKLIRERNSVSFFDKEFILKPSIDLNFKSIDLQYNDLESALNDTHKSNVCGNDGISSYMILNSNISFIKTIILQFFKYIFKYGYIPDNFNVSHIIPIIIKDKNKSSSDVNNLRPISISNTNF